MNIDGRKDFYAPKRYMVEFFASLAIVYVTTLTNIFVHENKTTYSSLAINAGFCMAIWSWLLRERSGGVLNPALALGYAKVGQIPFASAILYILVQILGGLFAGALIFLQLPEEMSTNIKNSGSGMPVADNRYTSAAFVIELIASAFLAFVVIGLFIDKRSTPETFALGFGCFSTVSEIAIGQISGGTCNPARLIGPVAVLYRFGAYVWLPVLAQFLGALIGAMLYDEIFGRVPEAKGVTGEAEYEAANEEGTELMPQAKGEVDVDIEVGGEGNVDAEVDVEVEADADAECEMPEGEAEVDAEVPVEAEVGVEADAEVDAEVAVEAEAE